jgi:hypothetical protein
VSVDFTLIVVTHANILTSVHSTMGRPFGFCAYRTLSYQTVHSTESPITKSQFPSEFLGYWTLDYWLFRAMHGVRSFGTMFSPVEFSARDL